MSNILGSSWIVTVNGVNTSGLQRQDYCEGLFETMAKYNPSGRVQLIRIDRVETDFVTTGRNWDNVQTVEKDTKPEPAAKEAAGTPEAAAETPEAAAETVVVFELANVHTFTRPQLRGTREYFGRVEWFNAMDRATELPIMGYDVSRAENGEIVINGPRGLIHDGCKTLREAAEFIAARR